MVYGFVKQSGGFVTLESVERGGTAVHVHLPRCVDDGQRQGAGGDLSAGPAKAVAGDPQPDDVVENPAADDASPKILFVEDDPPLRMLPVEEICSASCRERVCTYV